MNLIIPKIKHFWTAHEPRIVLALGLILLAGVAFESGYLKGKTAETSPIIIEKPVSGQNLSLESAQGNGLEAQKSAQDAKIIPTGSTTPTQNPSKESVNCAFVGSKNSNKYHLPTSRCAKQIKPENLVCFASVEDAKSKSYQAGCLK